MCSFSIDLRNDHKKSPLWLSRITPYVQIFLYIFGGNYQFLLKIPKIHLCLIPQLFKIDLVLAFFLCLLMKYFPKQFIEIYQSLGDRSILREIIIIFYNQCYFKNMLHAVKKNRINSYVFSLRIFCLNKFE